MFCIGKEKGTDNIAYVQGCINAFEGSKARSFFERLLQINLISAHLMLKVYSCIKVYISYDIKSNLVVFIF